MLKYIVLFLLLLCLACSTSNSTKSDVLPELNLESGQSDTMLVSDLFYAPDYNLQLKPNPLLQAKYNAQTRQLILMPQPGAKGWTALRFEQNGERNDMPIHIEERIAVTISYRPKLKEDVVRVIGSFNTWDRNSPPMTDTNADGVLEKTFYLRPGRYEYKFYVNRDERIDPKNPNKVLNSFGMYNSVLAVHGLVKNSPQIYSDHIKKGRDAFQFYFKLANIAAGDSASVLAFLDNQQLDSAYFKLDTMQLSITLPKNKISMDGLLRVAIQNRYGATALQTIEFKSILKHQREDKTFSWYDAIPYSIMIDRFKDGDPTNTRRINNPKLPDKSNYYGGDLQGVLDKLDAGYFTKLGVNVLWLSPVVQNPWEAYREYPEPHRFTSGYHGYWPIDSKKVDSRFGDLDLLHTLVEHAHAKGIKIILDFVSNHVHIKNPYFTEHRDWFGTVDLPDGRKNLRLWDEFRLTTWFETFLPSYNYPGSQAAVDAVTDDAVWWIKKTGVDGFRQDAVKHVPLLFWRTLKNKIRKQIEIPQNRKIFQIGETFGSDKLIQSYVGNGVLDAQFNFNVYDAAIYCFTNPNGTFSDLDAALHKSISIYGTHTLMGNIMDSPDKVRFLALADGDVGQSNEDPVQVGWDNPLVVDNAESYLNARLYLAYMLAIPGLPFIYYGDEIGMTGAADPDNRRPMRFGTDLKPAEKEMLKEVKKLIALRKNNSALRHGDFHTLFADKNIYAFVRSDMRQKVLIILNKGATQQAQKIRLNGFEETKHLIPLNKVISYVYDGRVLDITLPAYSAQFLLLNDN